MLYSHMYLQPYVFAAICICSHMYLQPNVYTTERLCGRMYLQLNVFTSKRRKYGVIPLLVMFSENSFFPLFRQQAPSAWKGGD